jgi:hypothetical protein
MLPTIFLSLDGYTELPAGKIANVATYLQLRDRPAGRNRDPDLSLVRLSGRDAARYLAIHRHEADPTSVDRRLGGEVEIAFCGLMEAEIRLGAASAGG